MRLQTFIRPDKIDSVENCSHIKELPTLKHLCSFHIQGFIFLQKHALFTDILQVKHIFLLQRRKKDFNKFTHTIINILRCIKIFSAFFFILRQTIFVFLPNTHSCFTKLEGV